MISTKEKKKKSKSFKRKCWEKCKQQEPSVAHYSGLTRVRTLLTAECRLLSIRHREETPSFFSALFLSLSLENGVVVIPLSLYYSFFFYLYYLNLSRCFSSEKSIPKKGDVSVCSSISFVPCSKKKTTSTKSINFIIHTVDGIDNKKIYIIKRDSWLRSESPAQILFPWLRIVQILQARKKKQKCLQNLSASLNLPP